MEPAITYVDENGNPIEYNERKWFAYEAKQDEKTDAITTYCRPLTQEQLDLLALDDMGGAESDIQAALIELAQRQEEIDAALMELAAIIDGGES